MADYLLTNLTISAIAAMILLILKDAPARLRFYVVLAALVAWLIPWHLAATLIIVPDTLVHYSNELLVPTVWLGDYQTNTSSIIPELLVEQTNNMVNPVNTAHSLDEILAAIPAVELILIIGILLLAKDIFNYQLLLRRWKNSSQEMTNLWQQNGIECSNISIRLLPDGGPGMATGIFKPVVWLNQSHTKSNKTRTILVHELNHIQQKDPIWMWLLTGIQAVLWWNPLARRFIKIAREQIELSCDEKCRHQLKQNYSYDLAEILLNGDGAAEECAAVVGIKNSKNFNIVRIEKLAKEKVMKTKYLIALVVGFGMSTLVGFSVIAKSTSAMSQVAVESLLVLESKQLSKLDSSGKSEMLVSGRGNARSYAGEVYVHQGSEVIIYGPTGEKRRTIPIPDGVLYSIDFVVLPRGALAFLDNQNDAIYFVDVYGNFLNTIYLHDQPDQQWQDMDGVVVGNKLIVSGKGNLVPRNGYHVSSSGEKEYFSEILVHNELVAVDLETYEVSSFRNLKSLYNLSAIAYSEGRYYVSNRRDIYSFTDNSGSITKVATLPEGNTAGIVIANGHLFAVVNGMSKVGKQYHAANKGKKKKGQSLAAKRKTNQGILYDIDLTTGNVTQVRDDLNFPHGVLLL
ncbi:M56 family metallopeptidase [Thalassotalea sp. ND16A]|uniref:M56 family metallopeptidase n=1 Tax=Thalassotalea sp. ND16A TaxID=1535422 RepID=UPI000519EE45|nr:M56 family metallopeptidase [Thalassotalea sp. ND16A]KGJ98539.1 hypothetical protein ND16A_0609 [Thalassotalea sp. ND16A]